MRYLQTLNNHKLRVSRFLLFSGKSRLLDECKDNSSLRKITRKLSENKQVGFMAKSCFFFQN